MILDTSAVLAILQREEGWDGLLDAMVEAGASRISAASVVEAGIVLESRYGDLGGRELDAFLYAGDVDVIAVTADHAELARRAWREFGKGRHPAGLNYGDCFSYALAAAMEEPLLFVGEDFARTDVKAAQVE